MMREFCKDILAGQIPNQTAIGLLDQSLACQCLNLFSSGASGFGTMDFATLASGFGLDNISQSLLL